MHERQPQARVIGDEILALGERDVDCLERLYVGLEPALWICGVLGAVSSLAILDPSVRGVRAAPEGAAPGT